MDSSLLRLRISSLPAKKSKDLWYNVIFLMQRYSFTGCHPCMKLIITVICLCGIASLFTACKKTDSPKKPFTHSISGTWELRETSAAMNPQVSTFAPGNGHILKFGDTSYEKYETGQLVKKGEYAIVPDPTVESSVCLLFPVGQFTNRIVYDNDGDARKQFLQIDGNKLVFVSGCYAVDAGYRMEYVKIDE